MHRNTTTKLEMPYCNSIFSCHIVIFNIRLSDRYRNFYSILVFQRHRSRIWNTTEQKFTKLTIFSSFDHAHIRTQLLVVTMSYPLSYPLRLAWVDKQANKWTCQITPRISNTHTIKKDRLWLCNFCACAKWFFVVTHDSYILFDCSSLLHFQSVCDQFSFFLSNFPFTRSKQVTKSIWTHHRFTLEKVNLLFLVLVFYSISTEQTLITLSILDLCLQLP